eukprot:365604-Chlamydomonas_euryale.AAC.3
MRERLRRAPSRSAAAPARPCLACSVKTCLHAGGAPRRAPEHPAAEHSSRPQPPMRAQPAGRIGATHINAQSTNPHTCCCTWLQPVFPSQLLQGIAAAVSSLLPPSRQSPSCCYGM